MFTSRWDCEGPRCSWLWLPVEGLLPVVFPPSSLIVALESKDLPSFLLDLRVGQFVGWCNFIDTIPRAKLWFTVWRCSVNIFRGKFRCSPTYHFYFQYFCMQLLLPAITWGKTSNLAMELYVFLSRWQNHFLISTCISDLDTWTWIWAPSLRRWYMSW